MDFKAEMQRLASKHMGKLVKNATERAGTMLMDAAYDSLNWFYEDYTPRYYRRTDNLKFNSYSDKPDISKELNHKGGGLHAREASVTFSPDTMQDIYREKEYVGYDETDEVNEDHPFRMTDTPVPKELIFKYDFIYGYHGVPNWLQAQSGRIYKTTPSPAEYMEQQVQYIDKNFEKDEVVSKQIKESLLALNDEFADKLQQALNEWENNNS